MSRLVLVLVYGTAADAVFVRAFLSAVGLERRRERALRAGVDALGDRDVPHAIDLALLAALGTG